VEPSPTLRRVRRRILRSLGLRGRAAAIPFVYDPAYRRGVAGVPMDVMRGERILTWLLDEGWVLPGETVRPRPAAVEHVLRVHGDGYLRALDDAEVVGAILGVALSPAEAAAAVELQRLATGGTIQASRLALKRRSVAVHLGGGFHHAFADRGTGLCIINDVAVAIRRLRSRGYDRPILVVDLDIHDGNGTRSIFADDPTVHTFSMHNETWDRIDAVADTSIAFGPGVRDPEYLELLEGGLPPVVESHEPGLVFYNAGADVATGDAFGDGALTPQGILQRDRLVMGTLGRVPVVVVAGGGYGPTAWRPMARFAGWLLSGRELEPPDEVAVALGRLRWVPAHEEEPDTDGDPFAWGLSADDLGALGAPAAGESRLPGRLTRARVEAELDRFGILEQLRARGIRDPEVELLASSGFGPTVRVTSSGTGEEPLIEVRLDVDHTSLPGFSLLRIEWLLLQHPGAPFRPARPPLPGQEHPGLGILADVMAWLVTLCRDMQLDGLCFLSSHFHIAALARRHMRFLREPDAETFRSILEATEGMPLSEVAEAVARGRVKDESTGEPFRWLEVPMVVPLTESLVAHLERETED
jgi:acetoin utilization deacetylase AcuC-like enzyme